jgi:glycosyltransferase involved in cell wall biosynthesis
MHAMLQIAFWLLLTAAVYSYFVYPLLLRAMTGAQPMERQPVRPVPVSLSLVITAYNEAGRIREKLDNSLKIDYPGLEILIASDCSSDATDAIVGEYSDRGVRLVRADQRLGKENAQRCAIAETTGEVVVFSDVATQVPIDALQKLSAYFANPAVGAVSSEDRFISSDGTVAGEGAYVKYEMWLRQMESKVAGLVGLSGSFFAARKTVCALWDIHSPSDFNTALNCARLGLRAVTAPDVLGYYKDLKDPGKEYQRKVRTVLRGITAIVRHPDVLNVFRFGLFSLQVWSHKVMRWGVPWFLVLLFAVSAVLAQTGALYLLAFIAQLGFYGIAFAAHVSESVRGNALVRIVYFFVQANIAIADACIRFAFGKRMTTWQPSAR